MPEEKQVLGVVRFGRFELSADSGELRKDDVRLKLSGQAIQVLAMLAGNPGRLVTREELQQKLWPGASYGDLDPQYLTAHYRVYLNEPDAKRVFAYIKKLQASSPVWNAETSNCTGFIGNIAEFMGLKTPPRWQRPENYVNNLKAMNGGRQIVHLSLSQ